METAIDGYKMASRLKNIIIVGMDCHIGSQITESKTFYRRSGKLKEFDQ